jgi:hypothetical protein
LPSRLARHAERVGDRHPTNAFRDQLINHVIDALLDDPTTIREPT